MLPYYAGLLASLNLYRIKNLLRVETGFLLSRILKKQIVLGRPWAASIEPTTSCNFRCTECPTGLQTLTRAKGSMNAEVFIEIIDKLSPSLFYLTLYFQGEPMLNPHFSEMVKVARSRRIFVATSTNGHYLDDNHVKNIISSGLSHLIISMDGLDQKTYEQYRVNGNLDIVTEGIHRLVRAKRAAKSVTPFIELQFLVMRHNEHQISQMRKFARQSGVNKLSFKTAQVYHFDAANTIIPVLGKKSRYRQLPDGTWEMKRKLTNRCHRIWSSLVITWDGKVVPCCYDKDAEYQSGNLLENTLYTIWKNHNYTAFRNRVLNQRAKIDICRNCGE